MWSTRRLSRMIGALLSIAVLSPVAIWLRLQLDDGAFASARLGGEPLAARSQLRAAVAARAHAWAATQLVIHAGTYIARRSRAELGAGVDGDAAL